MKWPFGRGKKDKSAPGPQWLQGDAGQSTDDLIALEADYRLDSLGSAVAVADGKRHVYSISIGPDGSSGVVSMGTVICDAVASFDAKGIHPLDVDLGGGENLADPVHQGLPGHS